MVKFGRHLQFYLESDDVQHSEEDPYIVPYGDVRELIGQSQERFVGEWRGCLRKASEDYCARAGRMWRRVFEELSSPSRPGSKHRADMSLEDEVRGLPSEAAIEAYAARLGESRSTELFAAMKALHSAAAMNCEALRKLAKKFDKGAHARGDDFVSCALLPELYSAPCMAHHCLETYIELMRDLLALADDDDATASQDEDDEDDQRPRHSFFAQKDAASVRRRADELAWLRSTLSSLPHSELSRLVAHRGFHCPRDGSDRRPLENSLSAYESAWAGGVHLCECDVALTKDEKLVLAHDEHFARLALEPGSASSNKKVGDLTMKEIVSLTFKSGTRPPLLLDVLRSAQAIGGHSKLIIEIKPGNLEACTALVRLFASHPDLMDCCAAVMSFDAWAMHRLRAELTDLLASFHEKDFSTSPTSPSSPLPASADRRSLAQRTRRTYRSSSIHLDFASTQLKAPKILLLTVAKEPQQLYELWVDVSDLSPVHSWLKNENGLSLDGVYLQYQKEMLSPKGMQALKQLSKTYLVGVWGEYKKDPDDYITATELIRAGISYVNTDLPRNFMIAKASK